jgi:hypothetical protein
MTTIKRASITAAVLCLVTAGCNRQPGTAASGPASVTPSRPASASAAVALTPEQLGALGAQIKREPNDAHALLLQNGLDEVSFAAAIRKVSEDPAAAKRYAAAYKQSNS